MTSNKLLLAQKDGAPVKKGPANSSARRPTPPNGLPIVDRGDDHNKEKREQFMDLCRRSEKRYKEELREIDDITFGVSHEEVVAWCFDEWAALDERGEVRYDRDMAEHIVAIFKLLKGLRRLETVGYWQENPFFGNKLCDFSIGTGAVEDLLPEILGKEFCNGMFIHGNDVSKNMAEVARRKLAGKFRQGTIDIGDMKDFQANSPFDTGVLSQSLPFVQDKVAVMSRFMSALRLNGAGIVIGEKPELLTVGSSSIPHRILFADPRYFDPITLDRLRKEYLGQNARGETLLSCSIDGKHDSQLMVVRKVNRDYAFSLAEADAKKMLLEAILKLQEDDPWASDPIISGRIRELCPRGEAEKRRKRKRRSLTSPLKRHYDNYTNGADGYTVVEQDPNRDIGRSFFGTPSGKKEAVILNSLLPVIPFSAIAHVFEIIKTGGNLIIIDRWKENTDARQQNDETILNCQGETLRRGELEGALRVRDRFDKVAELSIPVGPQEVETLLAFKKKKKD